MLAARENLEEARLLDRITILLGDAMRTLNDIPGPIDLVLLDGWKDLYLPVLQSLESRLTIGALNTYAIPLTDTSRLPFLWQTVWK